MSKSIKFEDGFGFVLEPASRIPWDGAIRIRHDPHGVAALSICPCRPETHSGFPELVDKIKVLLVGLGVFACNATILSWILVEAQQFLDLRIAQPQEGETWGELGRASGALTEGAGESEP